MFKVGDKVIYIGEKYIELDKDRIYTIYKIRYRINYDSGETSVIFSLTEVDKSSIRNYFTLYKTDEFISLKEYRKQKLQKICSRKVTK